MRLPTNAAVRLAAIALVVAGMGIAQKVLSAKAGLVYFVLGRVSIAGSGPLRAGMVNRQLRPGGILFSDAGRAEVLLNPGAVLRIGDRTRIRMDNVDLTNPRVSIEAGSAVITINELEKPARVEIRIGGGVVVLKADGVYRFDADSLNPRVRVFGGQAETYREAPASSASAVPKIAKRGQSLSLPDLQIGKFDLKDADALQQWAEKRGTPPAPKLLQNGCLPLPANASESAVRMRNCTPAFDMSQLPAPPPSRTPSPLGTAP